MFGTLTLLAFLAMAVSIVICIFDLGDREYFAKSAFGSFLWMIAFAGIGYLIDPNPEDDYE